MNLKIGTITFTDEKYHNLSLLLIESILKFTNLPVTLFTIDYDYTHPSNRVSTIRLNKTITPANWHTTCFYKHLACSKSPYEITIYVDSDIIVTPDFEQFFIDNEQKIIASDTIFGIAHPHTPSTDINSPTREHINSFFNLFGVDNIPGYILASTYAFNSSLKKMFCNLFEKDVVLASRGIIPLCGDEMTLNLYLFKKNLLKYADCGVDFSPNYSEGFFENYINDTWETCHKYITDYKNYGRSVKPILFHGNKDIDYAKFMIRQILQKFNCS